jgi:hypothetical protein
MKLRNARVPKAIVKTVAMGTVLSTSVLDGGERLLTTSAVATLMVVPSRYKRLAR